MEDIYMDTHLHFCEAGEDIEPYEKSLQRTISIRLYQDEVEELCRKSGKVGLSIGELFENFVADLICGTHTNGSDERILSNGLTGAISVLCQRKHFYLICLKCGR